MNNFLGYDSQFLGQVVEMPTLNNDQQDDLAPVDNNTEGILGYTNYSLKLSASRRFPYFTACNIDGLLFKKAPRKDSWRKDERVNGSHQWGTELYKAELSDFDKGHMTKREDVQWGDTISIAREAAASTFFYTNAVPQHAKLNQKIWRSLEDYILHMETKERGLRVNVFTGPVLGSKDPFFVTQVEGEQIRIPFLFWKIVYYVKSDQKLYCAGFLMSQSSLLFNNDIVEEDTTETLGYEEELFMEFKEASTYQVNINTIQRLTQLTFPKAIETYQSDKKIELILEEIDVEESLLEGANEEAMLGFSIANILI